MIVYIDTLVFTNTVIDFILLTAAGFIVRRQSSTIRCVIASLTGGLSSLYFFVQSNILLVDLLVKILFSIIIVIIANGIKKGFLLYGIVFLGLSFLLNGISIFLAQHFSKVVYSSNFIDYYDVSPIVLILITVMIYTAVKIVQRVTAKKANRLDGKLVIDICSRKFELEALIDTGNSISDPFSSSEVFIIAPDEFKKVEAVLSESEAISRKRIVPVKTVGSSNILSGYRCDMAIVRASGKQYIIKKVIVVSAEENFNGNYSALISPNTLERICDSQ